MAGRCLGLSLLLSLLLVGCAHPSSWVPRCESWPETAIEEFIELRRERGETALIQAVLRDARFCAALARI